MTYTTFINRTFIFSHTRPANLVAVWRRDVKSQRSGKSRSLFDFFPNYNLQTPPPIASGSSTQHQQDSLDENMALDLEATALETPAANNTPTLNALTYTNFTTPATPSPPVANPTTGLVAHSISVSPCLSSGLSPHTTAQASDPFDASTPSFIGSSATPINDRTTNSIETLIQVQLAVVLPRIVEPYLRLRCDDLSTVIQSRISSVLLDSSDCGHDADDEEGPGLSRKQRKRPAARARRLKRSGNDRYAGDDGNGGGDESDSGDSGDDGSNSGGAGSTRTPVVLNVSKAFLFPCY